jgi:hypothetical protein
LLFYSYEKLYLLSRGEPAKIMSLFKKLMFNKLDVLAYLSGNNWIVEPSILLLTNCSDLQCSEFLGLLSFRHYSEYKYSGKTELSVRDLPSWVDLSRLTPSTLWHKEGNKIMFPTECPPIII